MLSEDRFEFQKTKIVEAEFQEGVRKIVLHWTQETSQKFELITQDIG